MGHGGSATHTVLSVAIYLLIIVFSPVILVAGEPVNRYVMRRVRRDAVTVTQVAMTGDGDRSARAVVPSRLPLPISLLFRAMRNPLWIALTAPGRWVMDRW